MRAKEIGYWATTVPVSLELLAGAEWDLAHRPDVVQVFTHLGYPLYLLTILGVWKLLGGLVLLVPRFPRLKEWAYAGTVFDLTGAAASAAACGDKGRTLIVPLVFAALALASWALRPQSRVLGVLLPAKPLA